VFEKQERKTKIYANLKNVNLSVSGEKDLNELQKGNVPFIIEREKTLWCNLCGLKSPDPFIPIQSLRTHLVKSHDFNPELPIPIHITPFESDDEYSSYYMKSLTYERIAEHEQGRRKHRSEYEEDRLNDTFFMIPCQIPKQTTGILLFNSKDLHLNKQVASSTWIY
jgi:hypothetical protein